MRDAPCRSHKQKSYGKGQTDPLLLPRTVRCRKKCRVRLMHAAGVIASDGLEHKLGQGRGRPHAWLHHMQLHARKLRGGLGGPASYFCRRTNFITKFPE